VPIGTRSRTARRRRRGVAGRGDEHSGVPTGRVDGGRARRAGRAHRGRSTRGREAAGRSFPLPGAQPWRVRDRSVTGHACGRRITAQCTPLEIKGGKLFFSIAPVDCTGSKPGSQRLLRARASGPWCHRHAPPVMPFSAPGRPYQAAQRPWRCRTWGRSPSTSGESARGCDYGPREGYRRRGGLSAVSLEHSLMGPHYTLTTHFAPRLHAFLAGFCVVLCGLANGTGFRKMVCRRGFRRRDRSVLGSLIRVRSQVRFLVRPL
jgi:hypothetical protein